MATADDYARWIVDNADKKGTPEFETVAAAYKLAQSEDKPAEFQEPEWLSSMKQEHEATWKDAPGAIEGGLKSFAKGASFGWADELAGLVSQLTGGDYESARADFDARTDKFEELAPGAATATEVVGGLVSGFPAAKAAGAAVSAVPGAAKAVANAPKWAQLAGAGGAAGGLYGAGAADPGERLAGTGSGAAIGATTGVLLPPLVSLAGKGVRKAGRLVGDAGRWLVSAGSNADDRAAQKIAQALRRDQVTPEQAAANMRKMGDEAMVVDAAGENLRGLGEATTSLPGRARNVGKKALEERAKGAQSRIVQVITRTLGIDDVNFDKAVQGLHENMRRVAAEHGYDDILNSGTVEMTDELEKLMGSGTMRRALRAAYSILDDDIALGRADKKLQQYFKVTGDEEAMFSPMTGEFGEVASRPTLRAWDYVKRGLDSIINDGTDALTGKMSSRAESAAALKRALLSKIDDANPDYAAVRAAYADEKAAEAAMGLGRKFMREDAEVTARRMADMSEPEQNFFRLGAARALYDKVMNSIDTGTSWRSVVKNPLIRGKVEQLFPDRKARAEFMRTLENELKFAESRQVAGPTGKSPTMRGVAAQADLGVDPAMIEDGVNVGVNAARGSTSGTVASLVRALRNRFGSGIPENVRNELADALFSQDPAKIQQIYAKVLRAPAMRAPIERAPASVALGAASGQQAAMQQR